LGSIDANTGDALLGWDTDQFPTDIYLTTGVMLMILAWVASPQRNEFRRQGEKRGFEPVDLFHAHIGGMERLRRVEDCSGNSQGWTFGAIPPRALRVVGNGIGRKDRIGRCGFRCVGKVYVKNGDVTPNTSGRQEMLENLINEFI